MEKQDISAGPGQRSRYRDSLRAGRSGVQTRVKATHFYSTPVQTGPGDHPASCTTGTAALSWDTSSQVVAFTIHPT